MAHEGSQTTDSLAQTPLHNWHRTHGARLVDFAGWDMPVQYTSIVAEHVATRTAAGLFDISHMGRLRFDGPDAAATLDGLVTRRVADMQTGQVRYALVTNEHGGILDDVLVYRLSDAAGGEYFLLVVNASNREKIVAWIEARHNPHADVQIADLTPVWAMIAVQGPRALAFAQPLVEATLPDLKYYAAVETRIAGCGGVASRTGYTGEDGCELIVGAGSAQSVWERLVAAGATPAGLGCRDTLRLEAAMPLYGHELSEDINPFQAGLAFAVDLEKADYPGREELLRLKAEKSLPRRVGLTLDGKRIAREGCLVLTAGATAGYVTSGTWSPTLEKSIAMAYVRPELAAPGTRFSVEIRGRTEDATVVKLPFYRR